MRITIYPRSFIVRALSALGLVATSWGAPIAIQAESNASNLVNTIKGSSITIVGTPTLTGGPTSAATFTNGLSTGIGINSGIVLTSGDATLISDHNTSSSIGTNFGGPGDSYLTGLSGKPTYDATVLAFDFRTSTGNLFFNFVFASDEYSEWANTDYNDVFAFTVDGQNLAHVPGTQTPISVNTINAGNSAGGDTTPHNAGYFVNNEQGQLPFEYDGFTRVFTISTTNLDTTRTHSMRLAISDASDGVYDSGVFIQGGSFDEVQHPHDHDDHHVPEGGNTAIFLGLAALALLLAHRFMPLARH